MTFWYYLSKLTKVNFKLDLLVEHVILSDDKTELSYPNQLWTKMTKLALWILNSDHIKIDQMAFWLFALWPMILMP